MKRATALLSLAWLAATISCGGEQAAFPVAPKDTTVSQSPTPITGTAVPGFASFEIGVRDLMQKYKVPGGAIAVVRNGKLIYARGFGYADAENKVPVKPDALFRIALRRSLRTWRRPPVLRSIRDGSRSRFGICSITPAAGIATSRTAGSIQSIGR